jgi:hypothetical protein
MLVSCSGGCVIPEKEAETQTDDGLLSILLICFNLAWAEQAEVGWEGGRGREEAAKVVEQAY